MRVISVTRIAATNVITMAIANTKTAKIGRAMIAAKSSSVWVIASVRSASVSNICLVADDALNATTGIVERASPSTWRRGWRSLVGMSWCAKSAWGNSCIEKHAAVIEFNL